MDNQHVNKDKQHVPAMHHKPQSYTLTVSKKEKGGKEIMKRRS
jgi:hypothetical protein